MGTAYQTKRKLRCSRSEKRFTVVRVGGDPKDTHAGRSFERAMELALPDRGDVVEVFAVCAKDGGEARLRKGVLVRRFRYKGRGA